MDFITISYNHILCSCNHQTDVFSFSKSKCTKSILS